MAVAVPVLSHLTRSQRTDRPAVVTTVRLPRVKWVSAGRHELTWSDWPHRRVTWQSDGSLLFDLPWDHPASISLRPTRVMQDGWRLCRCARGEHCDGDNHEYHQAWLPDEDYRALSGKEYIMPPIEYHWQTYTAGLPQRSCHPRCAIMKGGLISLNTAALALLGNPTHVVFLIDAEHRALGVRPVQPGEPGARDISVLKRTGDAVQISIRGLLKWAGVEPSRAKGVIPEMVDGVLVVALPEP